MKLTTIALAPAFALSGTFAFAHTVRHESSARTYPMYRDAAPPVVLHPNYGNPNGNPDGPTTLSGTGDSSYGGSSPVLYCPSGPGFKATPGWLMLLRRSRMLP